MTLLSSLDHVNIRTVNLAPMSAFYESVLGLKTGPRPPFSFGGAWHYCGGIAAVHLVEVRKAPAGKDPRLEHFAFRAKGMKTFLEKLRQEKIPFEYSASSRNLVYSRSTFPIPMAIISRSSSCPTTGPTERSHRRRQSPDGSPVYRSTSSLPVAISALRLLT